MLLLKSNEMKYLIKFFIFFFFLHVLVKKKILSFSSFFYIFLFCACYRLLFIHFNCKCFHMKKKNIILVNLYFEIFYVNKKKNQHSSHLYYYSF